jgi:hypothetical protein
MDNQEINKKENEEAQIEKGEAKEPTREELVGKVEEMISRVEKDHNDDEILNRLKDKLIHLSDKDLTLHPGIIEEVNSLVDEAVRLVRKTVESIKEEEYEPSIDHLKNYKQDSVEAQHTKIIKASEKIQNRFNDNEKIHLKMKKAIALVCGQVFNHCENPYALIGSNCYIPHTEYSAKIPDDLDVIFGINDYDMVCERLSKLENKGLISELKVSDVLNTDGTKGDKKIHCWITNGSPNEDDWVEMECFAQNMATQRYNGADNKSYIPLGDEDKELEVIEIIEVEARDENFDIIKNDKGEIVYEKVKGNIGSEKVARELYLKNIIKEFNLYNKNGWEHKAMLNAKALQRIFNLINMDSEGTEESINNLMDEIAKIRPKTETIRKVRDSLIFIWNQFKSLPVEKEESIGRKKGLVNWLVENADNGEGKEKGLNVSAKGDSEKEKKILSTEAAVDFITKETNNDLKEISTRSEKLKLKYESVLNNENASKEEIEGAIEDINKERTLLIKTSIKYKGYMDMANSEDGDDFCVYAAMPELRYHFILPYSVELVANKISLKKKLENQ